VRCSRRSASSSTERADDLAVAVGLIPVSLTLPGFG
jgi:hypothetical protein